MKPDFTQVTRQDVLNAISVLRVSNKSPFRPSTKYDLVFEELPYPPKAVLGLAAERSCGRPLTPKDFKGGADSLCFRVLTSLGFSISPKKTVQRAAWVEMARDEEHGGGDWAFTKCAWAPVQKENGSMWMHWYLVGQVKEGDIVVHLRGRKPTTSFVGYSIAAADGAATVDRPPSPGIWSFAKAFFRVPLKDYTEFPQPISLTTVFDKAAHGLRAYYSKNGQRSKFQKRALFYSIQKNKLQCFNGGYFSELDDELAGIVFGDAIFTQSTKQPPLSVTTRQAVRTLTVRIGQKEFSDAVRLNYGFACCFPGCQINHEKFLIGAHIDRWADSPELRGSVGNGLCLCLFHDRAFEHGFFTLSADLRIQVNKPRVEKNAALTQLLTPYHDEPIRVGHILPLLPAIEAHWKRCKFSNGEKK